MATFYLEKGEFHEHSPNEDISLDLKEGRATVEFLNQKFELSEGGGVLISKGTSFKIKTTSETPSMVVTSAI